jgi:hypothetical protein
MPTIRFNLTNADKKSKKKASSTFLEAETEPEVVLSANVNIPAATATHPNLYETRSKRAKPMGNNKTNIKKKRSAASNYQGNHNNDTDEAAYIAEAINRANSERLALSSATKTTPRAKSIIQGATYTPPTRNNPFRAPFSDDDDNDEAANAAEAIASANSERFKLTRATKSNQEGITTIQGTHHPSPTRSIPFQAHFYDDNDDDDDNYSIRSGDDRKKPAPNRPSNTRKRPKINHDNPTSSPDEPPAKRTRFQTAKVTEHRRFTCQSARVFAAKHEINFVHPTNPKTRKTKVRETSNVSRASNQASTYQIPSDSSRDIIDQSDAIMATEFRNSDHDPRTDHQNPPGVLELGFTGPRQNSRDNSTVIIQYLMRTTPDSPSVRWFPHTLNILLRPTGFQLLPTPPRQRAPTPPVEVTVSNSQRLNRDQPYFDTQSDSSIPVFNNDPDENDDISATSDEMSERHTTDYNSDDSDDSDDSNGSEIVNKSDIFSIYCPRLNHLCLSVREHASASNSQQLTGSFDSSQDSRKSKLCHRQDSVSDQDSLDLSANSTVKTQDSLTSKTQDSLAAKTKDSLTLMDRLTMRKNTKTTNWKANIPKLSKILAPPRLCKKQHHAATPNNVANPFYSRPPPKDTTIPFTISIDDDENEHPPIPTSRLQYDDNISATFLDISTPKRLDVPPSPTPTFTSGLFSPIFSRLSSNDSAFDCLSTSTGITDFLERSNNEALELPYRLDKLHTPCPDDNVLDPIHHVPFLQHHSDLDSRTNPHASLLFYADATIHDEINGPVTMRNLPTCVDSSITASSFCLRYLQSSPTTRQCIRDLTTAHLCHLLNKLYPILITEPVPDMDNNQDEFVQCIHHTFNRATNLVMDNLTSELRSYFTKGIPSSYLSLLNDYEPGSIGHECSLSILYAFKMLYPTHLYIREQPPSCSYQSPDLADIIRNIPTLATTLRLFPNRSNFRDVPHFITTFFQDQQLTTSPYDINLDSTRTCHIQTPPHLDSTSLIAFTHSLLINGFGEPTTGISPTASHVARYLISQTLCRHAILSFKVTIGDDLHLQSSNIIIGPLPPADLLLNHNCSAFPMATLPATEQLSTMDPKLTVAINFVICRELTPTDLQNFTIPDGNSDYATLKSNFDPIKTDTYNYSIDFLPNQEYTLFRVTSNINVMDPQCVLPQSPLPTKVLIFQGNT